MSRIAAALLIVVCLLASNGGLLRPAFADTVAVKLPPPSVEVNQPLVVRSGRIMMLLMTLEALRLSQPPVPSRNG